jgi:hypothetical protein
MGLENWKTTPSLNSDTPPDGWPEGTMTVNQINDTGRQMMADVRAWYEDGGWAPMGHAHSYASATTTTIASDETATYLAGRRVRAVGSATGTIYGEVVSSVYSAPNTTITYLWDSGELSNEALTISVAFTTTEVIGFTPVAAPMDFRLSLTSGTPVTTSDVTGAGTLYLAQHIGNKIGLYYGSAWITRGSAEVSLALALSAATPYDIFAEWDGTAVVLSSTAWTNDTTRATAITRQDGVPVKTGDVAKRYIGTIYASGTNTTEDSYAKRFVWNYYNRVDRPMRVLETTDSWSYTTATWRQANANTANQLDFVIGASEDTVSADIFAGITGNPGQGGVGIGLDATSSLATGQINGRDAIQASSGSSTAHAAWRGYPGLGRHYIAWLERSADGNVATWFGDAGSPANAQSGIIGSLRG